MSAQLTLDLFNGRERERERESVCPSSLSVESKKM